MSENEYHIPLGSLNPKEFHEVPPMQAATSYLEMLLGSVIDCAMKEKYGNQINETIARPVSENEKLNHLEEIMKNVESSLARQIPRGRFGQSRDELVLTAVFSQAESVLMDNRKSDCTAEITRLFGLIGDRADDIVIRNDPKLLSFIAARLSKLKDLASGRVYKTPIDRTNTLSLVRSAHDALRKQMMLRIPINKGGSHG